MGCIDCEVPAAVTGGEGSGVKHRRGEERRGEERERERERGERRHWRNLEEC